MEGLSPLHLVIVLVVAVLVLGPGKLPEVGAALGKTIREFRKATSDISESVRLDASPATSPTPVPAPAAVAAAASVAAPATLVTSAAPPAGVDPGTPQPPAEPAPARAGPTSTP